MSDTSAGLAFWRRFSRREFQFSRFLLLKLTGAIKLSEPSFCNFPCCSIASDLCLVTNKKTLILNNIQIMVKFLDGATESNWVGLSETFILV